VDTSFETVVVHPIEIIKIMASRLIVFILF
jgi:hypothetical protein